MSDFRFELGTAVMCNFGPKGWKLGRIIALHYREEHWPAGKVVPYQVLLEDDHTLIYVPEDDALYCREATPEDTRIARRMDALATLPADGARHEPANTAIRAQLGCAGNTEPGSPGYRDGRCHGCHCCPTSWSAVELYSEHYRCAARNGLKVTHRVVELGTVRVGDSIDHQPGDELPSKAGFMQCPTLARLPPGLRFSDAGALSGEIRFDPHRDAVYEVEFVAVSTADWEDPAVGLVRLELRLRVEGNETPDSFDLDAFVQDQQQARTRAERILDELGDTWMRWDRGQLGNRETCDQMWAGLGQLRELLEHHPRLDEGRWWAWLGGYHMNVHKLLDNALFECELYLGHALTFGDAEVRRLAEQNLDGCYQKRLLEAARFMWIDGVEQMMRGEWAAAAETFRLAAAKVDGWGWALNYGDIWISEAAARLVHGAQLAARGPEQADEAATWLAAAPQLLARAAARADEGGAFSSGGHPWAAEIGMALTAYPGLHSGSDASDWLEAFKLRTTYWCAQILGGAPPFPPKPRARREDAAALVRRLPGHNT